MQCGETGGIWLDLDDARRVESPQAGNLVLGGGCFETIEPAHLRDINGNNQLPALAIGQIPIDAILLEHAATTGTQLGLQ